MPSTREEIDAVPQITQVYAAQKLMMYVAVIYYQVKKAMETGTDVGDSARIFATALRKTGGQILSIDIKDVDRAWAKDYPNVGFVKGDTAQLEFKTEIELLFLDDHTEGMDIKAHVLMELKKFGVWVKKGGVILIHDTLHDKFGVHITQAIREWTKEVGLRWMEDTQQHGMALIEVSRDLPH
mgnify:FL=1